MKKEFLFATLSLILAAAAATAAEPQQSQARYTPFMLSLVTPLQVPPADFDVGGLRINLLYGECHDFLGFDISTAGHATGEAEGFQAALLANVVDGGGLGFQAAPVNYVAGDYAGLQVGAVSHVKNVKGLQIGALFNRAEYVDGIQIGLINVTHQMVGVQIGLVNIVDDNDFPVLPVINGSF